MNESAPLLELDHVSRRRGGREAVRALDLKLMRGQVLGLLGVNGAGKSTTLAMVSGALQPDAGQIRLQGESLNENPHLPRARIGWLPERAPLWPELSVHEHLQACARLRHMRGPALHKRCAALLERLQLTAVARRMVGVLSQGQRQRVGLACALLHEPPLLVLDEPGNGLDPLQAAQLRELIRERAAAGCGVILSTHLLPEVTAVCDRVAILHEGRLRHDAPLTDTGDMLHLTLAMPVKSARIAALAPVAGAQPAGDCSHAVRLKPGHHTPALARAVIKAGLPLVALQAGGDALEQAFMAIATSPDEVPGA